MALKDLLVFVDKTAEALQRLGMAADLAARHGSRLTALYVHEWNEAQLHAHRTAEMGRVSGAELAGLDRRVEATLAHEAEEQRSLLEALGRERGIATEWRVVEGPASAAVPQHARYADLCILGHHRSIDQDPNSYTFSEKLLFSSGRPSLFIPPGKAATTLGRHIVVAWNSSRAAARSLNDALPLIERAERTTIITVNPEDSIACNGGLPAQQLVEHLARHGAAPELLRLEHVSSGSIGDTLQAKAREVGGDLMVAGAFGHPRLWERLLGGATRALLDRMRLPIMMSN
jgi:nucleotide-binding universal stress UspA family protein